ncbi:MAG: phytoene desaturase [Clostridium sp.]|nr:phytoene desaturase [Clostridium sp.]
MTKKAIIIGAGLGGLSIAARLCSKGFNVKVLEKNLTIGGKTNILKSGSFKFDLTATITMIYKDYIDVFSDCGKDYKEYFTFLPLSPTYRCFFDDNTYYDFFNDLSSLTSTVDVITKGDIKNKAGYFNFLASNYEKYLFTNKNLLSKNFLKSRNLLNPSTLYTTLGLNTLHSSAHDCKKFIQNEKLFEYLMFQTMYIGMSPYHSPSIYNLIPAASQMEGLYYIKGGMYSYIKALERLILEKGGKIYPLTQVNEILFSKNKAIGVMINGKKELADLIICNSDYTNTITNLIKEPSIKQLIKPVDNLKYSCSAFILYLALDKKYPNLKVHNIYINKNFKKNIQAPFKGFLSKEPSLYIYCPSSIDNSVCPENCEIINVTVRVPNLINNKVNWTSKKSEKIKKQILSILSSIDGLYDIEDHIIFDSCITPLDLRDRFDTFGGCAFGLSHSLNESLLFRPQCAIPKVKNLYFTGASIHPGNGVSMVLKSSKICSEKILKDFGL